MIGALRHRLALQEETRSADSGGGYTLIWSGVATVWGRIEPLTGAERLQAMQLESRVSHRVTIRHRTGVSAGMRLLHNGRALNIRTVIDPDERRHWLELMCEEGVAT